MKVKNYTLVERRGNNVIVRCDCGRLDMIQYQAFLRATGRCRGCFEKENREFRAMYSSSLSKSKGFYRSDGKSGGDQ